MYIVVSGTRHRVHVNARNPFAISHGRVIGITPDAPESMLPELKSVWRKDYEKSEDREWVVDMGGSKHQVLKIGDRFLCDCWPFRRTGDCKHITAVREECDVS